MFMQNGRCGFILKPEPKNEFMAKAGINFISKFIFILFLGVDSKDQADFWG